MILYSLFSVLNICSIRYPPYDDKTFGWIRWLMGAKEQSYNKLSDYPSLLVSIPVAVVRNVGILAASLSSK